MVLKQELQIGKPLKADMELILALMFTRERVARLLDLQVFNPSGITEPQFNVLRILRGGPEEGYPIREIKARMITPSADVPRLVDRMASQGWVRRGAHPEDARSCRVCITSEGEALVQAVSPLLDSFAAKIAKTLDRAEKAQLTALLERLRLQVMELE